MHSKAEKIVAVLTVIVMVTFLSYNHIKTEYNQSHVRMEVVELHDLIMGDYK